MNFVFLNLRIPASFIYLYRFVWLPEEAEERLLYFTASFYFHLFSVVSASAVATVEATEVAASVEI